jgi:hypothetical protein
LSPISVWLGTDGKVAKVLLTYYKSVSFDESEFTVKTVDEIKGSLSGAKVMQIDDGNVQPQNTSLSNLEKIEINKIEIGYLQNSVSDSIYYPIIILSGKTNYFGNSKEISISLYLPIAK